MEPADRPGGRQAGLPGHERQFYAQTRAFGRFGMRRFRPVVMDTPHWHGHIELNLTRGASLRYDFNGTEVIVPPGIGACFWAGVPHQLVEAPREGEARPLLCNIYLPVDSFLLMPFIGRLQVALLAGAIVAMPPELLTAAIVDRWYADYRSGDFERVEVVKMELNAAFRRLLLDPLTYLVPPRIDLEDERSLTSAQVRHVVEMVRFVLENLDRPLKNADIAAVAGLAENYAIGLFSRIMRVAPRQFLVRMRLMRARALLVESAMPIPTVAEASGFSSISQFYHRFREAYGVSPREMRERYVRMEL